jgi:hypothetical protein
MPAGTAHPRLPKRSLTKKWESAFSTPQTGLLPSQQTRGSKPEPKSLVPQVTRSPQSTSTHHSTFNHVRSRALSTPELNAQSPYPAWTPQLHRQLSNRACGRWIRQYVLRQETPASRHRAVLGTRRTCRYDESMQLRGPHSVRRKIWIFLGGSRG